MKKERFFKETFVIRFNEHLFKKKGSKNEYELLSNISYIRNHINCHR